MGNNVKCEVTSCKHNDDGECTQEWITISDEFMTAAGFYPRCMDYEEEDEK